MNAVEALVSNTASTTTLSLTATYVLVDLDTDLMIMGTHAVVILRARVLIAVLIVYKLLVIENHSGRIPH